MEAVVFLLFVGVIVYFYRKNAKKKADVVRESGVVRRERKEKKAP